MKQTDLQKIFIMLVGVPAAGKSYFIKHKLPLLYPAATFVVISSDDIIERKASEQNKTYSDIFQNEIKNATAEMNQTFVTAVSNGDNIVWDQTNLSSKVRRGKLSQVPKSYTKIAVVFPIPEPNELKKRLASRPGKNIPAHIVSSMIDNFQPPSKDEGFDKIISP